MSDALLQPSRTDSPTGDVIAAPSPIFLVTAFWFIAFATLNLPERDSPASIGGLDELGLIKVGIRGAFLTLLGWGIFCQLRLKSSREIVLLYAPLCVFVGWAFISTIWSPLKTVTFGQSIGQLVLLFISIHAALSTRNPKYESLILLHLCATLTAFAIVAVALHFMFPEWAGLDRDRYVGLYHPTSVASASAIGLMTLLASALVFKFPWARLLMIVGLPAFVIALVLSANRLSLALVIPIAAFLILKYTNRAVSAMFLLIGCALLTLYVLLDPGLVMIDDFMNQGADYAVRGQTADQLAGLSGREEMWAAMWDSYRESPIYGHGYFVSSGTGEIFVWHDLRNHNAHNLILQSLVATGLIGLLILVWWKLSLLRYFITPGIGKDTRYLAILIPFAIWYFFWTLLNAAYVGPIRPESVAYAVIVGLFIARAHQTRRDSRRMTEVYSSTNSVRTT